MELHDICLLNYETCELVYKHKDDFAVESKVTNIFI